MAQQITIDIVAETQKLTSGVNAVNGQLKGLAGGISSVQQQAVGLASAFVLTKGVTFAKKAADEFLEAEKTAKAAASAFGQGSTALKEVTKDAERIAEEIAVDNDEIIKLATGLGVKLPKDAQASSAELVLLAKNLEASSGGAIAAESTLSKLGKAFADGEVTSKELAKTVPGLTKATYDQAEALSKAGKNQEAMTLLVEAGQKRFGNAAADQVTGTDRMNKAMGELYETIGKSVAPVIETLSKLISDAVTWIVKNKEVVIPLVTILGGFGAVVLALNAGLTAYNGIMSAWKVATSLATTAQGLFNAVMAANPIALVILAIVAIIAIIVLLVKNWDTVTEVVGKVWEAIKDFAAKAWEVLKSFGSKVANFVGDIIDAFKSIPGNMLNIGKDIITGLWNGMNSMVSWFKNKVLSFLGNLLPSWAEKALGIASPSKVFSAIGENIVKGLTTPLTSIKSIATPQMAVAGLPSIASPINITINAGLGTDPYKLGKEVNSAISKYGKVSTKSLSTKVVKK